MKGTQDVIRGCIVAEVIIVTFLRGKGINKEDPARIVHQYYDKTGALLAENDTWKEDEEPFAHSSQYTKWRPPDER